MTQRNTTDSVSRQLYHRTTTLAATLGRAVTGAASGRPRVDRRSLGVLLLCALAVVGGCVTATVDSTVTDEETIQEYHVEIEMEPSAYNLSRENAIERGYSSSEPLRDVLETDLDLVQSRVDEIDYEVRNESDGNRTISLTLRGYVPSNDGNVTLTKRGGDGGTLVYEDRLFTNDTVTGRTVAGEFRNDTSIEYSLEMPHEITNSTADSVGGTTATWTDSGSNDGTVHVYAESDLPAAPDAALEHDPAEPTAGESVTFDASASTDDDAIGVYRWDFDGDGTVDATTTSPTVDHTYDEDGQYVVELVVVDVDGHASDPVTETVSVQAVETPASTPTPTDTAAPTPTDSATSTPTDTATSGPTDGEASTGTATPADTEPPTTSTTQAEPEAPDLELGSSDVLVRLGLIALVALVALIILLVGYVHSISRNP